MDLGIHEGVEIPMPMSCNFAPIHEVAKLKMLTANENGSTGGSNGTSMEEIRQPFELKVKKAIRYRECLKNHAANLGGHATDGCGEFMPSGGEGTLEALKCAACDCHRNFHRREVEGEPLCELCHHGRKDRKRPALLIPSPHAPLALPQNPHLSRPPSQMIMALSTGLADSDDQEGALLSPLSHMKKRFRTKFTAEQKEKMCSFAEKVGWRIQKHDEAAVQQFCAEIGVKRHVLKVWMHNNKHVMTKKL